MALEFGPPKNFSQAWIRIPDKSKSNFDEISYDNCTSLRDHLFKLMKLSMFGALDRLSLEGRTIPLEADDLRLLYQCNSFQRDLENATTINWSCVWQSIEPWNQILPLGDNQYRWWQLTNFTPDVQFGDYRLYSIEMNDRFESAESSTRFNERSEFEVVLAREEEINILKEALTARFKH